MKEIKSVSYLIIFLIAVTGCSINNSGNKEQESLYNWKFIGRLSGKTIKDIRLADDNTILGTTDRRIYVSDDNGAYFRGFGFPDSVDAYRLRKYNDDYYLVGEMYSPYASGFWGGTIRLLFVKKNGTDEWEKLHGGYLFQDVLVKQDNYFVGALNGVTVVNAEYNQVERFNLFNSKLNDQVDDMIEFHDYLLLSSHEGVFGSNDLGSNWIDLTAMLSKDHDHILKMRIDGDGALHAMAKHRSYITNNTSFDWEIRYMPERYDVLNLKSSNEYIAIDHDDVYQITFDESGKAEVFNVTPDVYRVVEHRNWQFIEALPEGILILSGSEGVFIGTPNPDSDYWN